MAFTALLVLVGTGVGWSVYRSVTTGFTTSNALAGGPTSTHGDQNVLIMGLDSRLDEQGNPLPRQMYDALHAGNQSNGGYNANVLILLHVPGDGSKATALSIPRDDYVSLSGCPDSQCKGKIKQAYGLALDQTRRHLSADGVTDPATIEQRAREAGRKAEIATVREFLGGVPIDHFVEVTLAAFFQIAQVVQPIEVCTNEDTSDRYSGAHFHQGLNKLDAQQAMAFVRQRRDPNTDLNFTDLDRERRQQAFIVSLAHKLQSSGTLTNPTELAAILGVAKKNIAVDSGLDLVKFAQQSSNLTSGNITFFTLPIDHFGQDANGEDVNIVSLPEIHAIVAQLLGTSSGATHTLTPPRSQGGPIPESAGIILDVRNSSGRDGLAGRLEQALSSFGFTRGDATTGAVVQPSSAIDYGNGAAAAATALADRLGSVPIAADSALTAGTVRLTIGTGLRIPAAITTAAGAASTDSTNTVTAATESAPPTPIPATGVGASAPTPTDLTSMVGNGVPCVK